MPITKRPCANCPFRNDGKGIALSRKRMAGIVEDLMSDDSQTFVCHKTLDSERMTCAGALGLMSKLGHLPLIARLGISVGVITAADIEASALMTIEPEVSGFSVNRKEAPSPNKQSRTKPWFA